MENKRTLIIAEAGVNHNGSEDLAVQLINAAHQAGADIVKFQTFKAKHLVTESAAQADYQVENTKLKESQFSMLSKLELSFDAYMRLLQHCNAVGIEFLSTAFDFESLNFLVKDLKLTKLKIPSGDLTNAPLVLAHAKTGCDLIISTGMATLDEITSALGVVAFGYLSDDNALPTVNAFKLAFESKEGQKALKSKVTLLHCTTEYPAPFDEINLYAMASLKSKFNLPTGYSDHTQGISVPIAAVALGAVVVEKHFTLDKQMEGPDHRASLNPTELAAMVSSIRQIEKALGDGIKKPQKSEIKNINVARKSLVAISEIKIGDVYTEQNMAIKRPGGGLSPYLYWDVLGTPAKVHLFDGDFIVD